MRTTAALKAQATERAIARYVRIGGDEGDGRRLLGEAIERYPPDELGSVLYFLGFTTCGGSKKLAAVLNPKLTTPLDVRQAQVGSKIEPRSE